MMIQIRSKRVLIRLVKLVSLMALDEEESLGLTIFNSLRILIIFDQILDKS